MTFHQLRATPETVRLSTFDANFSPVLTIESGDRVAIQCLSGRQELLPFIDKRLEIPQALRDVMEASPGMRAGHILTGPIAIAGAQPGDMLEVKIDRVDPGARWGYTNIRPLVGTLPDDFQEPALFISEVDVDRRVCKTPWGSELRLAPFLGIMGVAPPPAFGQIRSTEPRIHGGNMDNKELIEGSTLFLPVWVAGANFSAGDGHGVQGDGEVCVNALEMCLDAELTFILHKAESPGRSLLARPRAETPTHFISMGFHATLDEAMKMALREMIAFIVSRSKLTPHEAYALCSLAADFRVTQSVNGEKGVHGMLQKGLLQQ